MAIFVGDERRAASIRDVVSAGDAEAACSFCVRRFKGDLQKESFTEIMLFPRTEISKGPTTAQPQAAASAAASPKLSYRDENKKILDSCMWRASWLGAVEDKKVIRGWGDLLESPEPITTEVQDRFLSRKARRVLRRRGRFFW